LHFQKLRHHIRGRTYRNVSLLFRKFQMDFRGSSGNSGARDAGTSMEDFAAPVNRVFKIIANLSAGRHGQSKTKTGARHSPLMCFTVAMFDPSATLERAGEEPAQKLACRIS
jgi:hypothetical protein